MKPLTEEDAEKVVSGYIRLIRLCEEDIVTRHYLLGIITRAIFEIVKAQGKWHDPEIQGICVLAFQGMTEKLLEKLNSE